MAKWHYNPETGDVGRCGAVYKCRYQLSEDEHYGSAREASRAYEERQSAAVFSTVSKLPDYPQVSEPRIAAEKKSNSYHYQELWLRDENGKPAAYVKVNRLTWGELADGSYGYKPGIVVCDIEISPDHRGQNYALAAIRKLQESNGGEPVEFTGTFSEAGYRMYQRLEKLGQEAGTPLVKISHGERLKEPSPGEEYSFVDDWAEERGKYQL